MTAVTLDTALIHTTDPRAIERAQRLRCALQLVRQGHTRREVSGEIRRRFGVSPVTAWRISHTAWDLEGPLA